MVSAANDFKIRRFRLLDGREARIYCRLVKTRAVMEAQYRLYEDRHGETWLEIALPGLSCLQPLGEESFEQRVAAELLALGLNKYSG